MYCMFLKSWSENEFISELKSFLPLCMHIQISTLRFALSKDLKIIIMKDYKNKAGFNFGGKL